MHHSYKRRPDGKYSINGRVFERLVGSRAQVWHETAYKTSGGLSRMDLIMNKNGRIVSMKKHKTAKQEKRLVKHGYNVVFTSQFKVVGSCSKKTYVCQMT